MKHLLFLLIILSIIACDNDDNATTNPPNTTCGQSTIISSEEFANAPDGFHNINSVLLNGNCLTIDFGASGCDGSSWIVKLIDSEAVAESLPPQKFLRLSLDNQEICAAYFTKTMDFDLSDVQINENPIILNIEGYDNSILYEY